MCRGTTRSRSAPGKQSGKHFDDRDARAQRGIDRAEFEADVSAANDEESAGNIVETESAGGIHEARGSLSLNAGMTEGRGAGGEDDAVEGERGFGGIGPSRF